MSTEQAVFTEDEINRIIGGLESLQRYSYHICNVCRKNGISSDKVKPLADWAYRKGYLKHQWWVTSSSFNFTDYVLHNHTPLTVRITLLKLYKQYLYGDKE